MNKIKALFTELVDSYEELVDRTPVERFKKQRSAGRRGAVIGSAIFVAADVQLAKTVAELGLYGSVIGPAESLIDYPPLISVVALTAGAYGVYMAGLARTYTKRINADEIKGV